MFDDMFDIEKQNNINADCDGDCDRTACNGDCACGNCDVDAEMQDELDALDEEAEQIIPF
jgi:hypothetical protein